MFKSHRSGVVNLVGHEFSKEKTIIFLFIKINLKTFNFKISFESTHLLEGTLHLQL